MGFCTFLTNVGSKKLIELLAEDITILSSKIVGINSFIKKLKTWHMLFSDLSVILRNYGL